MEIDKHLEVYAKNAGFLYLSQVFSDKLELELVRAMRDELQQIWKCTKTQANIKVFVNGTMRMLED